MHFLVVAGILVCSLIHFPRTTIAIVAVVAGAFAWAIHTGNSQPREEIGPGYQFEWIDPPEPGSWGKPPEPEKPSDQIVTRPTKQLKPNTRRIY